MKQTGEFQLHDDVIDQHRHGRSAGLDHHVRRLAIERIARIVQFPQTCQRIFDLEQRALQIVTQTAMQIFRGGSQVDDMRAAAQGEAVGFAQYRAAAGGDDAMVAADQFGDHRLLDVAESRLTFTLEKLPDRAPDARLDEAIGVGKRQIQPLRQTAANAGFA